MLEFIELKGEDLKNAYKNINLAGGGSGNSKLLDGVEFTITGHTCVSRGNGGKVAENANPQAVFTTDVVGNVFTSMIMRAKVTFDHKIIEPNGSFDKLYRKIIMEHADAHEALNAAVEAVKGKKIRVRKVPYEATGFNGLPYVNYLTCLEIVE